MRLRNFKMRSKIMILVSFMILAMMGLSAFNMLTSKKIADSGTNMYLNNFKGVEYVSSIKTTMYSIATTLLQHIYNDDSTDKSQLEQSFRDYRLQLEDELSLFEKDHPGKRETELIAEIRQALKDYFANVDQLLTLSNEAKKDEAFAIAKTMGEIRTDYIIPPIDEMATLILTNAENANLENVKIAKAQRIDALIAVGFTALLAIIFTFFIARSITKPMKEVQSVLGSLAEGDLTRQVTYHAKDELGMMAEALNKATENLQTLFRHVADTAETVAASSEELSASAQNVGEATQQVSEAMNQLAQGADDQAARVSETGNIVGAMSVSIQQVARSAQEMADSAMGASKIAENGQIAVNQAISQIESVKENIVQSANVVKGLGERSQEIGRIIEVITSIATQTNLLALNAAIEAARAGVHGAGFAVVADEVRILAEQSRQAAEQISELIGDIQTETTKAVEVMNKGTVEVAAGANVVKRSGKAFTEIVDAVNQVVGKIQEVAAATQELTSGSEQVVMAVENIAAITEESAASAEEVSASTEQQMASVQEIASSAEGLARQAQELQNAVGQFKLSSAQLNSLGTQLENLEYQDTEQPVSLGSDKSERESSDNSGVEQSHTDLS